MNGIETTLAYAQGYSAGINGNPHTINPYQRGTVARGLWLEGFCVGKEDRIGAETVEWSTEDILTREA